MVSKVDETNVTFWVTAKLVAWGTAVKNPDKTSCCFDRRFMLEWYLSTESWSVCGAANGSSPNSRGSCKSNACDVHRFFLFVGNFRWKYMTSSLWQLSVVHTRDWVAVGSDKLQLSGVTRLQQAAGGRSYFLTVVFTSTFRRSTTVCAVLSDFFNVKSVLYLSRMRGFGNLGVWKVRCLSSIQM